MAAGGTELIMGIVLIVVGVWLLKKLVSCVWGIICLGVAVAVILYALNIVLPMLGI